MKFIKTNNTDIRFKRLCSMLDHYLNDVIGVEKQQKAYNQLNMLVDIDDVILLVDEDRLIGCGGIKKIDEFTAEVKRVFVAEEFRHHGYGRKIVAEIERMAASQGCKVLILETGLPMKGAQSLYTSCGFSFIENYGPYTNLDSSVCMKKIINNKVRDNENT